MRQVYKNIREGYNDIKDMIVVSDDHYNAVVMEAIEIVLKWNKDSVRMLDAGCGNGYLLRAISRKLSELSVNYELYGFDISDELVERSKLLNSEANIACSNLPETGYDDLCFDLIICSEVLEHLYEPLKSLLEMRRILVDDGVLLVTVPNGDRVHIDRVLSSKTKFQPADDVMYTYSEMNYLFRKSAFRISKMNSYGDIFPIINGYSRMRRYYTRIKNFIFARHHLYSMKKKQFLFVLKKDDYLLGDDT